MTLNIILISDNAVYMSSDFRITYRDGRSGDPLTQKQIVLFRQDWSALVSFAGVAETHVVKTGDWLVEATKKIPIDAEFEDLERVLLSADSWLSHIKKDSWLTFSVAAFVFGQSVAMLVSNFQKIGGHQEASPLPRLISTKEESKSPLVLMAGQPGAVKESDKKMLRGVLTSASDPLEIHRALARANKRASVIENTISSACFTAHLLADGTAIALPNGIDKDVEYVPDFIRNIFGDSGHDLDSILKPKLDAGGKPLPRRLKGMTAARQKEPGKVTLGTPSRTAKGDLLIAGVFSELGGWMFNFENVIAPQGAEESAKALVTKGKENLESGLVDLALNNFDFALRQDPKNADAHLERGIALMRLAGAAFQKSSKLEPKSRKAKQWLREFQRAFRRGQRKTR